MSPIINSHFNDQKIILTRPFFAQNDYQADRDLHSHNCIEFSYVLSGSADHILLSPKGDTEQQKLSRGNYMILDTNARHAYKNCTGDFEVLNLLFKQSFLRGLPDDTVKGLSVTRSAWYPSEKENIVELRMGFDKPQSLKNKKYLRLWLNLDGDGEPLDFGRAVVGLIADEDREHPYVMCRKGMPFYFLGEGEGKWVAMKHGTDGCFGAAAGSSVRGLRGWFAFPIGNLIREDNGESLGQEQSIAGVFFRYDVSEAQMAGRYLRIDEVMLVRDRHMLEGDVANGALVDFDKNILRISVSGASGSMLPDAHPEEIKVSLFDDGDFYGLIKELFPDFKYKKVLESPVNRVYFDHDESILSLFHICHASSRQNRHEWHRTVQHALSLILILSLDSFDRYIRPKKEGIIDTVKQYVEAHFAEDVTLTAICAKHFYSVPYVSHRFKEVCGCSFEQYVRQLRIKRAGELLLSTALSVSEIAERCGYTSPRSFRKAFVCVTGVSPLAFKKNYQ